MTRVVLVHWNAAECEERVARLVDQGHQVEVHCDRREGGALTRSLTAKPPDAVVLDLSRLPSHGRDIATWLRQRKATRRVPIVFVPGDEEKTGRIRQAFPDATFAPWSRMKGALRRAMAAGVKDPVVPKAADYSGTPLPRKLGIKAGSRVAVARAPQGFTAVLGDLPEGAEIVRRLSGQCQVVLLFCRALVELRADWSAAVRCLAARGGLWIAWPKRASGKLTDLDGDTVRAFGLDQGMVDHKVCAIDETWSGLRFARRRKV